MGIYPQDEDDASEKGTLAVSNDPRKRPSKKRAAARPKKRAAAKRKKLTPAQKAAETRRKNRLAKERAEAEKKRKRSEAAKRAAETRRKNREAEKERARQKLERERRARERARAAMLAELQRKEEERRKKEQERLRKEQEKLKRREYEDQQESARGAFEEVLEDLKRKKKIREPDRRKRRINTQNTSGQQRHVEVNLSVTEADVEQILYLVDRKVSAMAGTFPIWMASLSLASVGDRRVGSGKTVLNLGKGPQREIQVEAFESTGVRLSRRGMMDALEDLLLDFAAEESTLIFCHYVVVKNYANKLEMP
jgi:hypothetical protein